MPVVGITPVEMITKEENGLASAGSAYLQAAKHQLVNWHEWHPATFQHAQELHRPILLMVGASWCRWCQVMDDESFEGPAIAALINAEFVAIKVDGDERPDVDARYQAAVSAISGQAGWPLVVFLTPDGKPFFGGGYFSPEERYGRPGFAAVLRRMADAYRLQPADVEESANSVMEAIEQSESFVQNDVPLDQQLATGIVQAMLHQYDPRHAGFGSQPKFPHAVALDLLLDLSLTPGPLAPTCREVVRATLMSMQGGGIHDQLAGGFHRYAIDESWVVPRFEKIVSENALLLRLYSRAYQAYGDQQLASCAEGILNWLNTSCTDQEHGGFYVSQGGTAWPDPEGEYFTWTRAEVQSVLSPQEWAVVERQWHIRALGHLQHNPAKNVLHSTADLARVAQDLGLSLGDAKDLLASARAKLLKQRATRPAPLMDEAMYTGWNALCVSAYLEAGRVLSRPDAIGFALKTLDRVLSSAWNPLSGLSRVVAYPGQRAIRETIPATLDDYTLLALAALDAEQVTGICRYRELAVQLAEFLLEHFYDKHLGGFFDLAEFTSAQRPGALATHRKPCQDAPLPSGNSNAATLLLRLHGLTHAPVYKERARETLQCFSGMAGQLGLYAASYAQALYRLLALQAEQ